MTTFDSNRTCSRKFFAQNVHEMGCGPHDFPQVRHDASRLIDEAKPDAAEQRQRYSHSTVSKEFCTFRVRATHARRYGMRCISSGSSTANDAGLGVKRAGAD